MKTFLVISTTFLSILNSYAASPEYPDRRPSEGERLFRSEAVEKVISATEAVIENPKLRRMFVNCFPNTLDTTVHYGEDENGDPLTYIYTGDIPAMWLRDSGAQVWPYVAYINEDPALKRMIEGVIRNQFRMINIDSYANAFNNGPTGEGAKDLTGAPHNPNVFERKWEIDSHCYPVRLAYEYWKVCGDTGIFDENWLEAVENILATFTVQQRKDGDGPYFFLRVTDRQLDTKARVGLGNPVRPVGLIASAFRPSDDATQFEFLVPSNFFAVNILKKAAEILEKVNHRPDLSQRCLSLASEVSAALKEHAVHQHPVFGPVYAYETDGFGNQYLMDDANVPSLLSLSYLDESLAGDPIYQNTRKMVWSEWNPYFWRGKAGEGIGGPHIGTEAIWPMSIMMKAFTSDDDDEIRWCIETLMKTDAGTGFIHESFNRNDACDFTRPWFAWQNTLFGELILKIIADGRLDVLNSITVE